MSPANVALLAKHETRPSAWVAAQDEAGRGHGDRSAGMLPPATSDDRTEYDRGRREWWRRHAGLALRALARRRARRPPLQERTRHREEQQEDKTGRRAPDHGGVSFGPRERAL